MSQTTDISVGIVMGSDSDLKIMSKACEILDELGISYEVRIISAHRQPEEFYDFAKGANDRYKIVIAGAGKAAHLPGMTAALFAGPVIGVPIKTSDLGGVDSLYSIVQMPGGVPVATVAINGSLNAGLLAAEILAVSDETLRGRIAEYRTRQKSDIEDKDSRLRQSGYQNYIEKMEA